MTMATVDGPKTSASQGRLTAAALVLLATLFVAINVLAEFSLTSFRVDLTEDRLYSLSPATQRVLDEVEEPVTLRFYYSDRLGTAQPAYGVFADRVRDMNVTKHATS